MISYRPFEMHTHTRHSDGQFLVPELLGCTAAYGYDGVCMTDHNAVTGYDEVTPALEAEKGIKVIPGIEWTTFYGHLVVLGCKKFVDWRFFTPDTIDQALEEIREAGGTAGVAHPCEVGSPLMCGCNWEFNVTRWDLVDYVEIWSQENPMIRSKNQLCLPWYDNLLNEGHHLAVSAGRDWHAADKPGHVPLLTATYVGVDGELTTENVLNALHAGRTYVTLGPTVDVKLASNGKTVSLSEEIDAGEGVLDLTIGMTERCGIWSRHQIAVDRAVVIANGEEIASVPYDGETLSIPLALAHGWLRVELRGRHDQGEGEQLIALTSPIYVR